MTLTAERLRELLSYDPDTGIFTWNVSRKNGIKAGDVAGSIDNKGYVVITLDRVEYQGHRLAVLYVTSEWPECGVDHKNMIRSENWWLNLRLATRSQNRANTRVNSNNALGVKGISQGKNGKFRVTVRSNKKLHHIGYFFDLDKAKAAYEKAANDLHGEFARVV